MYRIIKNAIRCNHCGQVIVSTHRHDFVTCRCGCCHVDGGNEFLKRGFQYSPYDYTELSEFEVVTPEPGSRCREGSARGRV